MFNVGDKLTYHGRASHACDMVLNDPKTYGDPTEWVYENTSPGRYNNGGIIRCWNPTALIYNKPSSLMSFYLNDFELTVTGPEPYEEWFK